ncbi:unnamed protein product [Rhizophagus irregularis]|nr:unnamed protein product [Rhizophagus irregularis]
MEEGSGKHPTNGTKIHLGGFPKNRKKEPRFVVFPGHEDCLPVDFKTFCLLILFFEFQVQDTNSSSQTIAFDLIEQQTQDDVYIIFDMS